MDVLVKWSDGSINCLDSQELKTIKKSDKINIGTHVKMYYNKKWYYGTITATEKENESGSSETGSSDDSEPLFKIAEKIKIKKINLDDHDNDQHNIAATDTRKLIMPVGNDILETPTIDDSDKLLTKEPKNTNNTYSNSTITVPVEQSGPEEAAKSRSKCNEENVINLDLESENYPFSNFDSDQEDRTYVQTCEVRRCKAEVWSSCSRCSILLCWKHFMEDVPNCDTHRISDTSSNDPMANSRKKRQRKKGINTDKNVKTPEDFEIEGAPKEYETKKVIKINKKKVAQALRRSGAEYVSVNTKKTVKKGVLGPMCNTEWCKKGGRNCAQFSEECRQAIFTDFYKLSDLQLQREFIVRYVEQVPKKSSTTAKAESRRQNTNFFYLPLEGSRVKVCRKLFINTLSTTEKSIRTSLKKLESTGVIQKDRRGGRGNGAGLKDQEARKLIESHINRFPRVESHYCRKDSTREYLHSDLTLKRMYSMMVEELGPDTEKPCFTTYRSVFKNMNLSFHRPKKDQCGLCFLLPAL